MNTPLVVIVLLSPPLAASTALGVGVGVAVVGVGVTVGRSVAVGLMMPPGTTRVSVSGWPVEMPALAPSVGETAAPAVMIDGGDPTNPATTPPAGVAVAVLAGVWRRIR